MSYNATNNIADRLTRVLANRAPKASVARYALVSPTIAKVVVDLSFDAGADANRTAIASLFDGKARAIPNSFRRIPTGDSHRVLATGFVAANTLVEELTEQRASSMREIAKNVLMDDMDNTAWQVTSSSDGRKFIRRQHNEDLSDLMQVTASVEAYQATRHLSVLSNLTIDVSGDHNYVAYVNPETATIDYGYVVEQASASNSYSVGIVPKSNPAEIAYVPEAMVIEAAYNVDSANRLTTAANKLMETSGIVDTEALKAYYAKEYGYDPEYLRLVDADIEQHAVA